jgi:hypothetical protein
MFERGHEFSPPPLIKDDFVRIASLRKSWDDRPIVGAVVVLVRSSRQRQTARPPSLHRVETAIQRRHRVQRGFELEPGFRLRIFSEFGMAQAVAEKFVAGGRLLGLPE